MQSERGLQAAEAGVLVGASEFLGAFFYSRKGEWWDASGWIGAVAAGGRFCGLKAALLALRLRSYDLEGV